MSSGLAPGAGRSRGGASKDPELEVRRLVARELHDRVAQTLTGMLVDVENFKAEEVGWTDVVGQLDKIQGSTRQVLQSLRQLLHDLRGEEMAVDDFVDAVVTLLGRFADQARIKAELHVSPRWPTALARQAYLNLYRIIEEALANVRMHSGATEVHVSLERCSESEVALVIADDGRGLDTDQSRPMGLGTVGMKERAALLGGRLQIESKVGCGTTIRATFPRAGLVPLEVLASSEILSPREVPV